MTIYDAFIKILKESRIRCDRLHDEKHEIYWKPAGRTWWLQYFGGDTIIVRAGPNSMVGEIRLSLADPHVVKKLKKAIKKPRGWVYRTHYAQQRIVKLIKSGSQVVFRGTVEQCGSGESCSAKLMIEWHDRHSESTSIVGLKTVDEARNWVKKKIKAKARKILANGTWERKEKRESTVYRQVSA